MFKYVPDPPEKDAPNESYPTSPYSSTDSKKLHEAAERALDHYLKPTAPKQHCPGRMFLIAPTSINMPCWPTPANRWPRPA